MTAPRFRSTLALGTRQRRRAVPVDRATLVVFSLGAQRFGVPVECVERVLRHEVSRDVADPADAPAHVSHGGRSVPVVTLAQALGVLDAGAMSRVLVFNVQTVWVAALVGAVHEVATINAADVRAVSDESASVAGARGCFTRHGQDVIVLDMLAVIRAVYERAQRARHEYMQGAAAQGRRTS